MAKTESLEKLLIGKDVWIIIRKHTDVDQEGDTRKSRVRSVSGDSLLLDQTEIPLDSSYEGRVMQISWVEQGETGQARRLMMDLEFLRVTDHEKDEKPGQALLFGGSAETYADTLRRTDRVLVPDGEDACVRISAAGGWPLGQVLTYPIADISCLGLRFVCEKEGGEFSMLESDFIYGHNVKDMLRVEVWISGKQIFEADSIIRSRLYPLPGMEVVQFGIEFECLVSRGARTGKETICPFTFKSAASLIPHITRFKDLGSG